MLHLILARAIWLRAVRIPLLQAKRKRTDRYCPELLVYGAVPKKLCNSQGEANLFLSVPSQRRHRFSREKIGLFQNLPNSLPEP